MIIDKKTIAHLSVLKPGSHIKVNYIVIAIRTLQLVEKGVMEEEVMVIDYASGATKIVNYQNCYLYRVLQFKVKVLLVQVHHFPLNLHILF